MVAPSLETTGLIKQTFNTVHLPLAWHLVEAEEATYNWLPHDAMLTWAEANGLPVVAGPLIDFSSLQLPPWLWLWERDLSNMAGFMCKFVEAAVRRYRHRIRHWQLTAASNSASVLSLTEDELLGLTYRMAETVRQIDPTLEIVVGVAQPWGEYMATVERTHSPFVFADTLIRSGMNVAALDVELVMGSEPRGSYCRDLLEASRFSTCTLCSAYRCASRSATPALRRRTSTPTRTCASAPAVGAAAMRRKCKRNGPPRSRRLCCANPMCKECNGCIFPTQSRINSPTAA